MITMADDFAARLAPHERSLDGLLALQGQALRALEGRRTLRWERDGHAYYVKQHFGVGWREIVKNLMSLRLPVLGADREWQALRRLAEVGIPAPRAVAFAADGVNPARRRSVIAMTAVAPATSLEDIARHWADAPLPPTDKRSLIAEVATIARRLHGAGINHRDFYLCHFLMPLGSDGGRAGPLHLIDLHRAQLRRRVPARWRLKDLAGLRFSATALPLSRTDLLRFVEAYEGQPWRRLDDRSRRFWHRVAAKAARLRARLGDPLQADVAKG